MRAIRTLNLSLLVNPAKAEVLFNDRRFIPEGEAQPFTDEQALLALLRRLTGETAEPSAKGTDETSSEHRFPAGGEP